MIYDGRAVYHVRRFPRPPPSVFAYCKRWRCRGPGNEARREKAGLSNTSAFLKV